MHAISASLLLLLATTTYSVEGLRMKQRDTPAPKEEEAKVQEEAETQEDSPHQQTGMHPARYLLEKGNSLATEFERPLHRLAKAGMPKCTDQMPLKELRNNVEWCDPKFAESPPPKKLQGLYWMEGGAHSPADPPGGLPLTGFAACFSTAHWETA